MTTGVLGAQCSVLSAWCSVFLWLLLLAAPVSAAELTGLDGLRKAYDSILDADFDQADLDLKRACPPAPQPACDVLAATRTWWRIQLDPDSLALDRLFTAEAERAVAATEAWAAREPANAEAHFYAGAAYAARVQWRVLRDEKLAAARDGKRIKAALERAIALDPRLEDAYFGIGLYQYYADVAPAAAKFLRFLLLLPGGDKTEGLARMRRAHAEGKLLKGEADYQLQIIYLWYERRPDLAVEILDGLRSRYPGNPLFAAQLADVQERYQHDLTASLATWRGLLAAARDGTVNDARLAEAQARLGMARMLDAVHQTDTALEHLRAVVEDKPARPAGALAEACLALGEAEDRLGHRDAAVAAYRLAIAAAPSPDPREVRRRAGERGRRAPDATRAEAYRLSLEGWRRLEREDAAGAEPILARAVRLDPHDPVARYRHARALQARRDDERALAEYDAALRGAKQAPAPIAAAAFLDAARLEERLARREQAIAHYRAASTWFGGGAETRAAADRALRRLQVVK
jgi:Tfp pilus assembly protein PilF